MGDQEINEKIDKLLNSVESNEEEVKNTENKDNNSLKQELKKDWKFYLKWGLIVIVIIIVTLFLIVRGVNGLDKGVLCSQLNLSINDCDLFWNNLFANSTIIINQTTVINNVTNNYNNYSQPIDLATLHEQNRHSEAIAKIDKGIIDNNGSQSILTSNFATIDGLNNALNLYVKTSDYSSLFDKYYLGKINNNITAPVVTNTQSFWDTSYPLFIGIGILIILIYVVPKFIKKGKGDYYLPQSYQYSRDPGIHIPKEPIKSAPKDEKLDGTE